MQQAITWSDIGAASWSHTRPPLINPTMEYNELSMTYSHIFV